MLPFLTYALREMDGILFIVSGSGIYLNDNNLELPDFLKETTTLYPNPSGGHFQIQSETVIDNLKVYDSSGRLILSQQDRSAMNGFEVREQGLYIFQILAGKSIYNEKIIVKKLNIT